MINIHLYSFPVGIITTNHMITNTKCLSGHQLSWPYDSWIYNYLCNQCLSPLKLWVRIPLDTTLCDKVCQWLTTGRLFSPGTPVSSTNKTDSHDIAEILLKAAFNTINQTKAQCLSFVLFTMEPDHLKHIYSCIVRFIDLQPKCMLQSIFNLIFRVFFLLLLVEFHAIISIISFQFVILSSTILHISINISSFVYDKPGFTWNTSFLMGNRSRAKYNIIYRLQFYLHGLIN
jgi:hypothetical protein